MLDETAIVRLFDTVEPELGWVAVSAGINGYVNGKLPSLRDTSLQSWNSVFAVHATGFVPLSGEMFRRRADRSVDNGRVILIGSMAAEE